MRTRVRPLASLGGLRFWHCCELWCVRRRCGSDLALLWLWCGPAATALIRPPSLGTSICSRCGPKKTPKKVRPGRPPRGGRQACAPSCPDCSSPYGLGPVSVDSLLRPAGLWFCGRKRLKGQVGNLGSPSKAPGGHRKIQLGVGHHGI